MTNWELHQEILSTGLNSCCFVIVDCGLWEFDRIAVQHIYHSTPVWTRASINNFIKLISESDGVFYILNEGINPFIKMGGFIQMYEDSSLMAQRQRKLGKLKYEIFKKEINK